VRDKHLQDNPWLADWFVFGEAADGTVDIADFRGDVIQGVRAEVAEKILDARAEYTRKIIDLLNQQ
jgi:hypothetical protein